MGAICSNARDWNAPGQPDMGNGKNSRGSLDGALKPCQRPLQIHLRSCPRSHRALLALTARPHVQTGPLTRLHQSRCVLRQGVFPLTSAPPRPPLSAFLGSHGVAGGSRRHWPPLPRASSVGAARGRHRPCLPDRARTVPFRRPDASAAAASEHHRLLVSSFLVHGGPWPEHAIVTGRTRK